MATSGRALAPQGGPGALSMIGGSTLFSFYRSHVSGMLALVMPDHTREALFQLICDLRANTAKDARFLSRHARALAPRTLPGWLALASALGFGFSAVVALACTAALLSVGAAWAFIGLAVTSGVFLACVLSVLGLSLLVAALVSAAMASGALCAYAGTSAVLGCARMTGRLLLGSSRRAAPAAEQQPAGQLPPSQGSVAANSEAAVQPHEQPHHVPGLPTIRTSPLRKVSPPASAPPASPRKLNPAAAAAASLELHAAAGTSPTAPPAPLPVSATARPGTPTRASPLAGSPVGGSPSGLSKPAENSSAVQPLPPVTPPVGEGAADSADGN